MSKRTIGILWIVAGIMFFAAGIISKKYVFDFGLAALYFGIGIGNLILDKKKK